MWPAAGSAFIFIAACIPGYRKGLLMIREAGGDVFEWDGNKAGYRSKGIIASNKKLAGKFLDFVGPQYRA